MKMVSILSSVYSYIIYPVEVEENGQTFHTHASYVLMNKPGSCYGSLMYFHKIYYKNHEVSFEQHFLINIILIKELQTVLITDMIGVEFMVNDNNEYFLFRKRDTLTEILQTYSTLKKDLSRVVIDLFEDKGYRRVEFYNKGRLKVIYNHHRKSINDKIAEFSGILPYLALQKMYQYMRPEWFGWKKETFRWCIGFNLKKRKDVWYMHCCAIPKFYEELTSNSKDIIKKEFCNIHIQVNR
jgi:hypothetical protein